MVSFNFHNAFQYQYKNEEIVEYLAKFLKY